jgi:multidrug efflux pump
MSLSRPFLLRPIGTSLLAAALAIAGALAFRLLPVSPLPQVDFPTVQVSAGLPGASPETMASAVATPLERQFSRIAGVSEMTSTSSLGNSSITLQFELDRDIDGAARDVQAAINAARGQLPANLPNNPTYRKVNPADSPAMILALTSDSVPRETMYDIASSVLAQRLAEVAGVGQVVVGGGALPAVRVELDPGLLNHYGIGLDTVRAVLTAANANRPKGRLSGATEAWDVDATDQLLHASNYAPLIVHYDSGRAVRLRDVGDVQDSVQDLRAAGGVNGKLAVLLIVFRQTGANVIETVDRVMSLLPQMRDLVPAAVDLSVASDRTTTIRASVHDVEWTLVVSILLVVLVVFAFLRDLRATLIPSVAVPLSLLGTFCVMALFGYSVDNLSLMALTISTGFVVDDAIVVIENISRNLAEGARPIAAALAGAGEIGFTVLSMSTSLVAVFIPILLMGGLIGRLFREFAVTLSAAIAVSLVVSLTLTPVMCARLLRSEEGRRHGAVYRAFEAAYESMRRRYESSLQWSLDHSALVLCVLAATVALNVFLYVVVPKGFFPQQDTGFLTGNVQGAQDMSFQSMRGKLGEFVGVLTDDPAIENVVAFTGGGGSSNTARMFISLHPKAQRKASADQAIARLRGKLGHVPGASLFLQSSQDVRVGGRAGNAQYQYTLQADNLADLSHWSQIVLARLRTLPEIADVNTDQQARGLVADVVVDRDIASRLNVSAQAVDDALYDAFGQRQVSTLYTALNQYHVVMEVAPRFWQRPETLHTIYARSSKGVSVPLSAFAKFDTSTAPLAVNHQGLFPAVTLSFNLAPSVSLGRAVDVIQKVVVAAGLPATVHGSLQGTARVFQSSLESQPMLILLALLAVYIVLGVLYESLVHPLTILSTLPSAGVGATLALIVSGEQMTVIALIGILLLIGIVKKNAIMMIDFAIEAERTAGLAPREAIFRACLLRFRPIMMTTLAAMFGAIPMAVGMGVGSELRRPLGIAIVGGLVVSQILTLYTTPVVYFAIDRLRLRWAKPRGWMDGSIAATPTGRQSLGGPQADDGLPPG